MGRTSGDYRNVDHMAYHLSSFCGTKACRRRSHTLKNGAKELAQERIQYAARAAARVTTVQFSQVADATALKDAVLHRMTPSALWSKPLNAGLRPLRTGLISTPD